MSKASEKIEKLFYKCFPNYNVKKEKYVLYCNTQLYFDFLMVDYKLLIEVQGKQHYQYVPFFHGDKSKFQAQKYRDTLKTQWVEENKYRLLVISEKEIEKLTEDTFKEMIIKAI